jgi:uncharacterized repeat protein (TIGR03987 family)
MTPLILLSVVLITLALIFYSVGVWSERIARRLKGWHAWFFWLGLVCDVVGTLLMAEMAGGFKPSTHGISGLAAVLLMTLHAVWATVVLVKRSERALLNFHKFSLVVWTLWLFPYFTGLWLGMKP